MFKINCGNEFCDKKIEYDQKKVANAAIKAKRICKDCKTKLKEDKALLRWNRSCPSCKTDITYNRKADFERADTSNQICRGCTDLKRRTENYSGLERECPKCNSLLTYLSSDSCTTANKRNDLCKSCSLKINGGFSDKARELSRLSKLGKKQSLEHINKRKESSNNKYDSNFFLGSKQHKLIMQNNGSWTDINGNTVGSILEEYNVPNSSFYKIIKQKNLNEDEIRNLCKKYKKHISSLELLISTELKIPHFNKKCHDEIKYRPDFKLKDDLYLNTDGLYWHSEKIIQDRKYHFRMREEFENKDLRIFQFRENEVRDNINIIKSMVDNALGKTENKVGARKCLIQKVSTEEAVTFLNENHIKGYMTSNHIGLYFKNQLVAIMSYRIIKETIKVDRFCSLISWNISGGFSRLLKYIQDIYPKFKVHYWVDLRYGTGNFLLNNEFSLEKETLGWEWTDFNKTYNRLKCRANMDDRNLSEKEHAEELKLVKIYDAGQRLYIK